MIDKAIKTNRNEYDEVMSLGGSCSAATQVQHRGKRKHSFPLDWTLMINEQPVKILPELIRTRFENYCKYENLKEFGEVVPEYKIWRCQVEDTYTGYRHIHAFSPPFSDRTKYEADIAVIRRRIARMYEQLGKAKHVLLVLATQFTFEPKLIEDVYEAFAETFQETEFELVNIQFGAEKCEMIELAGGQVHVARYERQYNKVYDNQLTAPEWSFLDTIEVAGVPDRQLLRKKNLKIKWMYKLWMWMGRYLEKHNAGCTNMRFMSWGPTDY